MKHQLNTHNEVCFMEYPGKCKEEKKREHQKYCKARIVRDILIKLKEQVQNSQ